MGPYQPFGNNAIIEFCPLSDIHAYGRVNGSDLTILLGYWDTVYPCNELHQNRIVDGPDLTILLSDWIGLTEGFEGSPSLGRSAQRAFLAPQNRHNPHI